MLQFCQVVPLWLFFMNHLGSLYGNVVSVIEILAVMISSLLLFHGYETWLGKGAIATTGLLYLAYFGYVFAVWM